MTEDREMLPVAAALAAWIGPGRGGRPIAPSTAWRWHRQGTRRPDGVRAYLRLTRVGGRLYIRRSDLNSFIAACSGAAPAQAPPAPAGDTAEVLERAGIRRPAKAGK